MDTTGIFGEWQLISMSDIGLPFSPSPDSVVTLTLNPPNIYLAGLNGKLVASSTFSISDSTSYFEIMHFNGIPATTFDSANAGYTIITFGTLKIGQFYLSPDQEMNMNDDTLYMSRVPIFPEDPTGIFKKLP